MIDYVTRLVPLPRCIIRGDFNAHYDFFKPGVNTFTQGGELVEWSIETIIDFIREVRILTQRCGYVLDLTFLNIPWA